jgi:hypothetical protein
MHRSGTSVLTRVINLLGLPLCREDDLWTAPDNPTGHWESTSLAMFNDRLLHLLGARFTAPGEPPQGWESVGSVAEMHGEAYRIFKHAHPSSVWVWKDPRTCLTLPFWREVLPDNPIAVFIHREPLEVARSLQHRDGYGKAHCIALWERYSRAALSGAAGMPLVTVRFADLVGDPAATVAQLRADLALLGVPVGADSHAAAGFVAAERAVNRQAGPGLAADRDSTDAQRLLLTVIDGLPRVSGSFVTPDFGVESAFTTELLGAIRNRGVGQPGLRVVAREIWPAVRNTAGRRLARRG